MSYDNNNQGALFQNHNKRGQSSPDYFGTIRVGGVEYRVSGWKKIAGQHTKRPGQTFLSLAITIPEPQQQGGWNSYQQQPQQYQQQPQHQQQGPPPVQQYQQQPQPQGQPPWANDDIPF